MQEIKKLLKQTSWQLLGKSVTSIITILSIALITRHYSEAGVGVYTLALTYLAMFYLAADLGLNGYILPEFVKNRQIASSIFSLRLLWSMVLTLILIFTLPLLPFASRDFNLLVLFGSVSVIFYGIYNSVNLIFQRRIEYQKSVVASSVGALLSFPLLTFIVLKGLPLYYLGLVVLISWFITMLVAYLFAKRLEVIEFELPKFEYLKKIFVEAWPISLTLLLNTVYFKIDSFILSSFKGFTDVGIYNIAFQVFQTLIVIPTFIMNGYYPMMLEKLNTNIKLFYTDTKKAFLFMFLLGFIGALGTYLFAPIIVLILTGRYDDNIISILQILGLSFPLFFGSSVLMWFLMSVKRYKQMFLIYLLGLIINLTLNYKYIPEYSYYASAWVTLISELLILVLEILYFYKIILSKGEK